MIADATATSHAAGSLRIEIVSDPARLDALRAPLVDLYLRDRRASPFQSPDWWLTWSEHFAPAASLRLVLAWAAGRLSACLPLMIDARVSPRTLTWVARGPTDYCDLLLDPDDAPALMAPLTSTLTRLASETGALDLGDVPPGSPLLDAWRARGGSLEPCALCPRVTLPADAGSFEASLPRWLSRNARRSERVLSRERELSLRRAAELDLDASLAGFFDLHTRCWQARGQRGVLDDAELLRFHRRAARGLLRRGALDLLSLCWGDAPVAAAYVLTRMDSYLYLFGYEPAFARLSLGSSIILRSIERAIERGQPYYDFLRGSEPYKYAWGAEDRHTWRLA